VTEAAGAAVDLRVLFYNTFLLRVLPLWGGRWVHAKPAIDARRREIGAALVGGYDVAALAEVFTDDDRAALLDSWRVAEDDDLAVAVGPGAGLPGAVTSSGLVTVARRPLVRSAHHTYRARGHRLLDVDAWANKGVLMVEVDVGLPGGNLEVYSTHLMYGGDLLSKRRRADPEVPRVRQAQAEELLAFAEATRKPENVAIIAGDLNVDAYGRGPDGDLHEGHAPVAALQQAFADAGYDDGWDLVGEGQGWTCDLLVEPDAFPLDPDTPDFCAEPAPDRGGRHLVRIDYAFVQRPQPTHGFDLRLDAFRRRPFPRPDGAPEHDVLATMSDHLGLHLELTATAR